MVARTVDPDQAVLLVNFVGDVRQSVLILAEYLGDAGDGVDVVDFVDRSQRHAAAAAMADASGNVSAPSAPLNLDVENTAAADPQIRGLP